MARLVSPARWPGLVAQLLLATGVAAAAQARPAAAEASAAQAAAQRAEARGARGGGGRGGAGGATTGVAKNTAGKCVPGALTHMDDVLCHCQPTTLTQYAAGCFDPQSDPDHCGSSCATKCGAT